MTLLDWCLPLLLILTFSRLPLFTAILAIAMLGFYQADLDLSIITLEIYRLSEIPVLTALPLFTFAGYLLSESQTSNRLVNLSQALLGWMPGSLAFITLFLSTFFTAFTGASGATIVALGALLLPALKASGYQSEHSLGLVTSAGSLGLIVPPALPLIVFGVVAQQMELEQTFTLQQLLIAGLIPAALCILLLYAYSAITQMHVFRQRQDFSWQKCKVAIKNAKWEIPLPFVVLGGIYSGWFTLSETATIACIYLLIVEVLVYKEIPIRKLPGVIASAMQMSGGILIVLASSLALANWIIDQEVPQHIFSWIKQYINDPVSFLIALNILLLILGALLDVFSAIVIMVPIIMPIAAGYGVHPIHLAIIFLANLQIGYLTPPIGMNLFISSYRFGKPITEIFKAVLPFILILLVALILITYVPLLSLFWL